jgi:hypothetical protein
VGKGGRIVFGGMHHGASPRPDGPRVINRGASGSELSAIRGGNERTHVRFGQRLSGCT